MSGARARATGSYSSAAKRQTRLRWSVPFVRRSTRLKSKRARNIRFCFDARLSFSSRDSRLNAFVQRNKRHSTLVIRIVRKIIPVDTRKRRSRENFVSRPNWKIFSHARRRIEAYTLRKFRILDLDLIRKPPPPRERRWRVLDLVIYCN